MSSDIDNYLDDLMSGRAATTRPSADYYDTYLKYNPDYIDFDDYMHEEELIFLYEEREELCSISEEVADYLYEQNSESQDCISELTAYFNNLERSSNYLNIIKKRYDECKDLKNKHLYMYAIYDSLKELAFDLCNHYKYESINSLLEDLKKELLENEIYNIKKDLGEKLLEDLKILESKITVNDSRDSIILDIKDIIENYFLYKEENYKKIRAKKYTKRKERKIEFFKLKLAGYSNKKISEKMNVTPSAISKFFSRNKNCM